MKKYKKGDECLAIPTKKLNEYVDLIGDIATLYRDGHDIQSFDVTIDLLNEIGKLYIKKR